MFSVSQISNQATCLISSQKTIRNVLFVTGIISLIPIFPGIVSYIPLKSIIGSVTFSSLFFISSFTAEFIRRKKEEKEKKIFPLENGNVHLLPEIIETRKRRSEFLLKKWGEIKLSVVSYSKIQKKPKLEYKTVFYDPFPNEILCRIFKHLSGNDLAKYMRVSKVWKSIIESSREIWKSVCRREFYPSQTFSKAESKNWKKIYFDIRNLKTALEKNKKPDCSQILISGICRLVQNDFLLISTETSFILWDLLADRKLYEVSLNGFDPESEEITLKDLILIGKNKENVRIWNFETKEIKDLKLENENACNVCLFNQTTLLYTLNEKIKFLKLDSGLQEEEISVLDPGEQFVHPICFENPTTLLGCSKKGSVFRVSTLSNEIEKITDFASDTDWVTQFNLIDNCILLVERTVHSSMLYIYDSSTSLNNPKLKINRSFEGRLNKNLKIQIYGNLAFVTNSFSKNLIPNSETAFIGIDSGFRKYLKHGGGKYHGIFFHGTTMIYNYGNDIIKLQYR